MKTGGPGNYHIMLKIRTLLIIILVVALLPLAAFDIYSYETNISSRRQIVLERNLEIAKSVAVGFRALILQAVQTEEAGGLAIAQGAFQGDQITKYLKELQARNPALTSITYFAPNGNRIAATNKELNFVPPATFDKIHLGRTWAVSSMHPSPNGRTEEFHVITGIRIRGRLVALVSGVIRDRTVYNFINIGAGQGRNIGIIDANGRAVALSFEHNLNQKERNRRSIPSIRSALQGKPATIDSFRDPLDNIYRMGASVPIKGLGWAASVFQPVSEVLGPVRQEAMAQAIAALAALLLSLTLVLLVGRIITNPIAELAAHTAPFRQGEYTYRMPTSYRVKEINELAKVLNAVATETQRRYEVEKHIASTLQDSLLPAETPEIPGYDISTRYASATEHALVGGDFYDFLALDHGKAGIVIGDVQGKGVDAAVMTVTIKFALRDLALRHESPAEVLKILNSICRRELLPEQFITLIYMVLNIKTGEIEYASAGHHPPIICSKNGCRQLTENGTALGILEEAEYKIGREHFKPQEVLALYTDGIVEARIGGYLFGLDRLSSVIVHNYGLSPQDISKSAYTAAVTFGGQKLLDDLALVIIKRQGGRAE